MTNALMSKNQAGKSRRAREQRLRAVHAGRRLRKGFESEIWKKFACTLEFDADVGPEEAGEALQRRCKPSLTQVIE